MNRSTIIWSFAACAAAVSPAPAQWSTDMLTEPRVPAATAVGAKVLFGGGRTAGTNIYTSNVDIYDTATNTWTRSDLSLARAQMAATSVAGRAFFAGGSDGTSTPIVDIYDAATGTWSTTTLFEEKSALSAASAGGKAVFAGGIRAMSNSAGVDIYDSATDTWSTSILSMPRGNMAATSIGSIILFAGGVYSGTPVATVDIYDTSTDTWTVSSLSQPRGYLSAARVAGKAYFAGGDGDFVDVYDAATATWSVMTLPNPRRKLTVGAVGPFAVFAGGLDPNFLPSDVVDIYDTLDGTWSTTTLSAPRQRIAAVTSSNRLFFAGGVTQVRTSAVIDIFDPILGTNYCSPALPNSTGNPARMMAIGTALVADNDVRLVAGDVPPAQVGYFLAGQTQGMAMPPASDGVICLTGAIARFNEPGQIIQGPIGVASVDLTNFPLSPAAAVLPGETWNFQCWYRDGASNNFTDAVSITFE